MEDTAENLYIKKILLGKVSDLVPVKVYLILPLSERKSFYVG